MRKGVREGFIDYHIENFPKIYLKTRIKGSLLGEVRSKRIKRGEGGWLFFYVIEKFPKRRGLGLSERTGVVKWCLDSALKYASNYP